MNRTTIHATITLLCAMVGAGDNVLAQAPAAPYPTKPIRFISPRSRS